MKKACAVLLCLLHAATASAWNLSDHREMARLALQDVAEDWGLTEECEVRPLSSFLGKLGALRPEIADPWQFSNYLKVNPKLDLGTFESYRYPEGARKPKKKLAALEILELYATDADDGRDQNLFHRDAAGKPVPAYPDQKWLGGIQGPTSQAFRHIEKPPFRLGHPLTTFGVPLRTLGEASQRAEIYFRLSQLAFALGEDYWGWRFLAGGLHYLQDLHQPYHAGQVTPALLWKGLKILFSWGWDEKGFFRSVIHVVANSHRFFETYVDDPQGLDGGRKQDALAKLPGTDLAPADGSIADLARGVRDASNLLFPDLTEAVSEMTGENLSGREEFLSDGERDEGTSDPNLFIAAGPGFARANQRAFEIVADRFASAGRVTRTYVRRALDGKNSLRNAAEVLGELDAALGPSNAAIEVGETE